MAACVIGKVVEDEAKTLAGCDRLVARGLCASVLLRFCASFAYYPGSDTWQAERLEYQLPIIRVAGVENGD